MTKLSFFLLLVLSTLTHAADWTRTPFVNPRLISLEEIAPQPKADLVLPITVVFIKNSQWSTDTILARWQRVREILRPCRIDVHITEMIEVGLPPEIESVYAPNDQKIASLLPAGLTYPVAFFGGGNVMQTYLDEFAEGSPRRSLIGTIWVGDLALSEAYKARIQPEYEVVAHETGHVLGIESHVRGRVGNLMSGEPGYGNASVTADQCDQFRASPYLTK